MPHMHLKKSSKNNTKLNLIILSFLLMIVLAFSLIGYINRRVSPFLLVYAEEEVKKISGIVMNEVVLDYTKKNNINTNTIFTIVKNSNNEINMVDLDSKFITSFLSQITKDIYENLRALETGKLKKLTIPSSSLTEYDYSKLQRGIVYELPITSFLNNTFLSNLGPRVPVRFAVTGNVSGHLETNVRSYGINNAVVEVVLKIEVIELVNLPFSYKKISFTNSIPISIQMIQGKVPTYYNGNINQSTPILINPVE